MTRNPNPECGLQQSVVLSKQLGDAELMCREPIKFVTFKSGAESLETMLRTALHGQHSLDEIAALMWW